MPQRVLPLVLAVLCVGCTTETPTPEEPAPAVSEQQQTPAPSQTAGALGDFTHVITADTAYYTSGPQQARPPDGMLKAGTKVRLVEDAGSYSRVQSEDGVAAYVSADAIKPVR